MRYGGDNAFNGQGFNGQSYDGQHNGFSGQGNNMGGNYAVNGQGNYRKNLHSLQQTKGALPPNGNYGTLVIIKGVCIKRYGVILQY